MTDKTVPTGAVAVIPDGTQLAQVEVQNIGHYAKTIAYIVFGALIAALAVFQSAVDWDWTVILNATLAAVAAVGVYWAPKEGWAKAWIAAISAALQALVLIAPAGLGWAAWGSIVPSQWLSVLLTLLGGFGVWAIPNTVKSSIQLVSTGQPIVASAPLVPIQPISNIQPADFGPITFPDEEKAPPAKKTTSAKIVVKDVPLPKKSPGTGV
jgi:hypothetical protein